jgi:kynurenine formamidase
MKTISERKWNEAKPTARQQLDALNAKAAAKERKIAEVVAVVTAWEQVRPGTHRYLPGAPSITEYAAAYVAQHEA